MGSFRNQDKKESPAFSPSPSKEEVVEISSETVVLEPVYHESYDLSYTCLLIPHPNHQLRDGLAENLPQWLKQICFAFNWQIEFITIHPDYFQWGLRVVPSVQTGQFMQEIRQQTSKLIFSTFEQIHSTNPDGDFWAPGYLVVLGTRPHPKEMIEQYIRLSRRQHGTSPT
jgi:REP element-mobilizing transposase RayT